jgi:membrane protease subunit (stomatin/prohibitin family)
VRIKTQFEAARAELAEAIVAERKDGALIEDITANVTYRQTQVNRILEAAGLTEKRPRRES